MFSVVRLLGQLQRQVMKTTIFDAPLCYNGAELYSGGHRCVKNIAIPAVLSG